MKLRPRKHVKQLVHTEYSESMLHVMSHAFNLVLQRKRWIRSLRLRQPGLQASQDYAKRLSEKQASRQTNKREANLPSCLLDSLQ